jgi:hypothetical protein
VPRDAETRVVGNIQVPMVCRLPAPPPRVGLRLGETLVPAIPVYLTGETASLVLARSIEALEPARLVLRWADGSVTELSAEIVELEGEGRIAHLDVLTVAGDWQPFVDYLGLRLGDAEERETDAWQAAT